MSDKLDLDKIAETICTDMRETYQELGDWSYKIGNHLVETNWQWTDGKAELDIVDDDGNFEEVIVEIHVTCTVVNHKLENNG